MTVANKKYHWSKQSSGDRRGAYHSTFAYVGKVGEKIQANISPSHQQGKRWHVSLFLPGRESRFSVSRDYHTNQPLPLVKLACEAQLTGER